MKLNVRMNPSCAHTRRTQCALGVCALALAATTGAAVSTNPDDAPSAPSNHDAHAMGFARGLGWRFNPAATMVRAMASPSSSPSTSSSWDPMSPTPSTAQQSELQRQLVATRKARALTDVRALQFDHLTSTYTRPARRTTRPASQPWVNASGQVQGVGMFGRATYTTSTLVSRASSERPFDSRMGKRFEVAPGLGVEFGLDTLGTSTLDDEIALAAPEHSNTHFRGSATSIKIVDASVGWDAISTSAFQFSVVGGVRGIGVGTDDRAPWFSASSDANFQTLPVIGGQMRFNVDNDVFVRGSAVGNFGSSGSSYLDLGAELGFGLTTWADLVAGYKLFQADLENSGTELDDSAFYASVRVEF